MGWGVRCQNKRAEARSVVGLIHHIDVSFEVISYDSQRGALKDFRRHRGGELYIKGLLMGAGDERTRNHH